MKSPQRDVVAEDDRPGTDERLNELLEKYGAFLRSAVARLCPSSLGVTPDEIEQDARIRLWRALARERTIADPASYLYRIAATAAIDAVRRLRARRESQLTVAADADDSIQVPFSGSASARSPEQLASDSEIAQRVRAALARLPPNRRRAVGLHLRGFSSAEIGHVMRWSEPKARNLTHRGLKDLRSLLRTEGLEML